jgi:hypothetical protein
MKVAILSILAIAFMGMIIAGTKGQANHEDVKFIGIAVIAVILVFLKYYYIFRIAKRPAGRRLIYWWILFK